MKQASIIIAALLLPGIAQAETQTKDISVEGCIATIQTVSAQYDTPPTNVVETPDLRIVKWFLSDGTVMVACSRPDGKMVVTKTSD